MKSFGYYVDYDFFSGQHTKLSLLVSYICILVYLYGYFVLHFRHSTLTESCRCQLITLVRLKSRWYTSTVLALFPIGTVRFAHLLVRFVPVAIKQNELHSIVCVCAQSRQFNLTFKVRRRIRLLRRVGFEIYFNENQKPSFC